MIELLNVASVPAIVAVVYWIVNLIKYTTKNDEKVLQFIPLISAGLGILCGVICFIAIPDFLPTDNIIIAIVFGGASGLTATGFNQIFKQFKK